MKCIAITASGTLGLFECRCPHKQHLACGLACRSLPCPQSCGAPSLKFYFFLLVWSKKPWLVVLLLFASATCIFSIVTLRSLPHLFFCWVPPFPNTKILKSRTCLFCSTRLLGKFTKTKIGLLFPLYIAQHRNSIVLNEWRDLRSSWGRKRRQLPFQ